MLVVLLTVILSFTGCGNKDIPSSDTNSQENSTGSTEKEEVNLKFAFWGSSFEKSSIEKSLSDFEAKYDWIKVEPIHIPSDYTTKLSAMLVGNKAPDVAYLSEATALKWASEGQLMNINEFIDNDPDFAREDVLDNVWYEWEPGKCLGISTAVEGYGIMYNKDLFDNAGVPYPPYKAEEAWTWEEFVEVCQKLTLDNKGRNALDPDFDSKNIVQYGFQYDIYIGSYMSFVGLNGGSWLSEDGTEFGLSDPKAIDAIQKLADLINVYHVAPSPVQAKSLPDTSIALQTKKIAMTMNGNWILLDLANYDINLGIAVLPKLEECNTFFIGAPTVVFSDTKHPEESWLLYKWLANPETSLDLHAGGLWMPLMKEWYEKPELVNKWARNNKAHPDEYVDGLMKQVLENGKRSPAFDVKNFGEMRAILEPALDKVFLGQETAEEALKRIEPQIEPLIDGYYGN